VPVYISEAAPEHARGMLSTLWQLAIVIGIVLASLANVPLALWEEGWRISYGGNGSFSILLLAQMLYLPESPRWLGMQGDVDQLRAVLTRLRFEHEVRGARQRTAHIICSAVAVATLRGRRCCIFAHRASSHAARVRASVAGGSGGRSYPRKGTRGAAACARARWRRDGAGRCGWRRGRQQRSRRSTGRSGGRQRGGRHWDRWRHGGWRLVVVVVVVVGGAVAPTQLHALPRGPRRRYDGAAVVLGHQCHHVLRATDLDTLLLVDHRSVRHARSHHATLFIRLLCSHHVNTALCAMRAPTTPPSL
jgi:hypothetical protein